MGTIVIDKAYSSSHSAYETIVADMTDAWNWTAVETVTGGTKFCIDEDRRFGIYVYNGNSNYTSIGIMFGTTSYHIAGPSGTANKLVIKFEKIGTDTMIISAYRVGSSDSPYVAANLCDKYIICKAVNTLTEDEETVLVYIGSSSTSGGNKSMMFASDVMLPADVMVQNANANINAKNTNLIPLYNTASAFITKDVYMSLCENVSSWYFGNVFVNDKPYRMSGSVFVLDE